MPIDTSSFQLASDLEHDDDEEAVLLRPMARDAAAYIDSFSWAPPIRDIFLAFGVGQIVALFLVQFENPIGDQDDEELWVVVGDLPSAYFVTDDAPTSLEALTAYCELMEDWADAVLTGANLTERYPVKAAPTTKHAEMLKVRMQFLRSKVMPTIQ